jgi:hypothetical protein
MSRPLVILVVVLVVLVAAMAWLSSRDSERPTTRMEQQVDLANLS